MARASMLRHAVQLLVLVLTFAVLLMIGLGVVLFFISDSPAVTLPVLDLSPEQEAAPEVLGRQTLDFLKRAESRPHRRYTYEERRSGQHFHDQINDENANVRRLIQGAEQLLRHDEATVRLSAIRLLRVIGGSRSASALTERLVDANEEVRLAACFALQELGAIRQAEGELAKLRDNDASVDVRVAAAWALGKDDERAVEAMKAGLGTSHWGMRLTAENWLEERGKLELPLPDHVYEAIDASKYARIKSNPGNQLTRVVWRLGMLYFELAEHGDPAFPPIRRWYKVKEGAPEKTNG